MNRRDLFRLACPAIISSMALGLSARPAAAEGLPAPWLPKDPGAARCSVVRGTGQLANTALRFAVTVDKEGLRPTTFDNGFTAETHALQGEIFSMLPRGGQPIKASSLTVTAGLQCRPIKPVPSAARAAERRAGVLLEAGLNDPASGLTVRWRATLRDGANYLREEVTFEPATGIDLASVTLVDLDLGGAWVDGTADGSPLIADDRFFGFEHPMAVARSIDGHATMTLKRVLPLRGGVSTRYSAVFGVAPHEQLRRAFQAYLENERAAPFRTFLHYNSWYDIGYFTPYTEAEAVNVIDAYGEQLVKRRGVKMESFLFDDGWDDHSRLWRFSSAFPHGFTPVREAAERYGADPGVWLSPWGGYGPPRKERLAAAAAGGYEIDDQGLALSGKKYFPLFHDAALNLLKQYGINQFKLDGTGSPDKVTPGSNYDSDFAAAIVLIDDLRAVKPDLFINLTTGTWPSPFWLRTADSIWRGGEDHSFAGVGTNRQRWITYRDADTYGGIVRLGPLFPLNSLMLHGIVYARKAQGLNTDPHDDFADEVRSYFATGTGLQELYVSPDLLSERNWDDIAGAAKWARARASVLRDSHWIGGDPARLQVYGWASWAPGHAVIALRNPSDQPQDFNLDVESALELPQTQPKAWVAAAVYSHEESRVLQAGETVTFKLAPFEVKVWDLSPSGKN